MGATFGASSPDNEEMNSALLGCKFGKVGIVNFVLDGDVEVEAFAVIKKESARRRKRMCVNISMGRKVSVT